MPDLVDQMRAGLAGRYRIERELGRGGMATVYLAEDLRHEREVALKILRPGAVADGYDPGRFLREIRLAARLTHPNILPVFDSGEHAGLLYYVAPVMGCETLRERLARERRLDLAETLRLARGLASALDYAHRNGVVHRDLKPENVLLQEGQPILCDFGVARALSAEAARDGASLPGLVVGTPAYMSPEQASGAELDGRADQYALACVVFEMLAGDPPFVGGGPRATMARHVIEPPPPIRALRPELPAGVQAALERALAKDPADRFPTATAFTEALAAAEAAAGAGGVGGTGDEAERAQARRAIAVLPFVNASPDPANEYLSDGLTDELIGALMRVEGLRVASRTSVFALKNASQDVRAIGARLGVSVVLEGSVRAAGSRLRIAAQLVDAGDGRVLWSERYDRELADVFALQDEIARTIVETLRATLVRDLGDPVPRRYTENVAAYTAYLKGRHCWNRRSQAAIAEGIGWFERAIAEDPGYAPAYTGLADSYALQVDYHGAPVAEGMERAKTWARRALALDETLAEAHTSLAWVLFIYDWDWDGAAREFRRALALDPRYATAHQWYAWHHLAMGRTADALAESRAALELEPGSAPIRRGMGWLCHYAGAHGEAVEHLRRALVMDPTSGETHRILGLAYTALGRHVEAEVALREALADAPDDAYAAAGLAQLRIRQGRVGDARAQLERLEAESRTRYVSPVALAMVHAALGEADATLAWLERARAERRGWLAYLKIEPLLDFLRGDARFGEMLREMRLA